MTDSPNPSILVLEDEAVVAMEIQERLRVLGYRVLGPVSTFDEAMLAADREAPDLLLADIRIPGSRDGVDAATALRDRLGVPAVYLSAYADEATITRATASSPLGFLTKPFRERELRATIETALHRARLERRLTERERELAEAQRVGRSASWEWDPAREAVTWSPRMQDIFGLERERLEQGGLPALIERVHADDRSGLRARLDEALASATPVEHRCRVVLPDGAVRHLRSRIQALHRRGERPSVIGISQDVTDEERAAAAARESEARLRQAQKLDAIGQLAGGIAHDFNNMLVVVLGLASVLEKQLDGAPGPLALVRDITAAGERARNLTRQLLAFARRQPSDPELVDVAECVDSFASFLRRTLGEHVAMVTKFAPDLWPIHIDPSQLEQVLLNLAVNARDAMPEGGRLEIGACNAESGAPAEAGTGPWVHLTVRDSGVGMDEATAARLFEPFFTTKEPGRGTGLGLATVYGIVRQAGGAISVETRRTAGSTFHVYFPRGEGRATGRGETEAATAPGGNEVILVAEDDEAVRATMERILADAGYRVLAVANAAEAMERARAAPKLDLLVTDVVMPGMSGVEAANLLAPIRPEMRILYMSGYTNDAMLRRGVQTAGTPFIHKPFTMQALGRKLRALLDVPPPRRR